jgi:hypothetical protein
VLLQSLVLVQLRLVHVRTFYYSKYN